MLFVSIVQSLGLHTAYYKLTWSNSKQIWNLLKKIKMRDIKQTASRLLSGESLQLHST